MTAEGEFRRKPLQEVKAGCKLGLHQGSRLAHQGDALPALVDHGNTPTAEFLERLRSDSELEVTTAMLEHVSHYRTDIPTGADVFDHQVAAEHRQRMANFETGLRAGPAPGLPR